MKAVYPHSVGALFREVAARRGGAAALVWSPQSVISFAELDRLSDRAAWFLREQGVRRGDRVGLRLDKSTLAYALIVGCLKSGAPYFVVDPANPQARAARIVATCAPAVVFSAAESPIDLPGVRVIAVERGDPLATLGTSPDRPFALEEEIAASDPAYIMFTSGSTGSPKGAVMSHANLLNFIPWVRAAFEVGDDDVFTNVNPLYFDNSVFDVYGSLFNGAALVPFDAATMKDPYRVLQRIDELGCTLYFSVPSLLIYFQTLKILTPRVFNSVRRIVFGGEGYPKSRLKDLFDCFADRARLVNVYGPTECTCICSAYDVTSADLATPDGYAPLGALIPNFTQLILDPEQRAAPAGEIGELYLGGPCVGLGYYGEPELSARAFVQNPQNPRFHDRLYRTGDLVRVSPDDGKLYFVGRNDSQIKHQGYRVELGEIEHALGRVPGVDEAVALHSTRDGASQILAVVGSKTAIAADVLRREAGALVPAYMVPARITVLDELPKNANGKIDRNLLKERYC